MEQEPGTNTSYNFNISEPDENAPEEKKDPQIANENLSTVNKAVVEISSSQKYKEETFKSFHNSKNIFINMQYFYFRMYKK